MGKKTSQNHSHNKFYGRRLTRITISIDHFLRIRLGRSPNPRLSAQPPVGLEECLTFLKAIGEDGISSINERTGIPEHTLLESKGKPNPCVPEGPKPPWRT